MPWQTPLGTNGIESPSDVFRTIRWPDWADDWLLYSTMNLTPPVVWAPVTNALSRSDGQFIMTVPDSYDVRLFRLVSP